MANTKSPVETAQAEVEKLREKRDSIRAARVEREAAAVDTIRLVQLEREKALLEAEIAREQSIGSAAVIKANTAEVTASAKEQMQAAASVAAATEKET